MESDVARVGILNWKLPRGFFALTKGWQLNVLGVVKGWSKKDMGMSVNIGVTSEILEAQPSIPDRFQTETNNPHFSPRPR